MQKSNNDANAELGEGEKKMHGGMGRNLHTTILDIVTSNTAEQITEHKYTRARTNTKRNLSFHYDSVLCCSCFSVLALFETGLCC